jgi:hypothetical protein
LEEKNMTTTHKQNLFDQVLDYANRPNPYPIYARMRERPVLLQDDGRYLVSTFETVQACLQDPRLSSDLSKGYSEADQRISPEDSEPPFLAQDPPRHDWLRHQIMSKFTPELIYSMRPRTEEVVKELLDARRSAQQLDVVDDFAYPLPVTVICELLGVPREDEPLFHTLSDQLQTGTNPSHRGKGEEVERAKQARAQLNQYMSDLIDRIQRQPRPGLLSLMLHDDSHEKHMKREELVVSAVLLLIAGHVTTVNLIANSVLTLLRYPEALEKLRRQPHLLANVIEEVLRYEPPVQFVRRTCLTDVPIAGVTIPKGAPIYLITASANRDPAHFADPEHFDPERATIEHFGFGGGIHYCVGAPLARLETEIALHALVTRLQSPHLLQDSPVYRESPSLRGPLHLPVAYGTMLA